MNALRVSLLHLRIGVMNELQYRVNFALQVLQSLLAVATGLIVLWLVYSYTTELNGWSESELLALLGIQILMGGLIRALIQPNMMRLMDEVPRREARLRADQARRRAGARQRARGGVWQAVDIVVGSDRLAVALTRLGGDLGAVNLAAFACALASRRAC